jgi:tetrahydromethanopterin S-methyltransferase subunit G
MVAHRAHRKLVRDSTAWYSAFDDLMKVVQLEPEDPTERLFERLGRIERRLDEIKEGVSPSIGKRFIQAAITAFGSILGAAVLVAIAAAILQPFTQLEVIGDRINRILNILEKKDHK